MPDCVVGVTYAFEPVPTDVEVGADGALYVTTLPGGPRARALGARGALWKFTPSTGDLQKIADGFLGATNLALGWKGEIDVAEYFAGKISVVKKNGKKSDYAALQNVIAVETAADGTLWAGTTINLDPTLPPVPGTIVQVQQRAPRQAHRTELSPHAPAVLRRRAEPSLRGAESPRGRRAASRGPLSRAAQPLRQSSLFRCEPACGPICSIPPSTVQLAPVT